MQDDALPPLISTQWLADRLDHPRLRLFDCTATMGPPGNLGKAQHYDKHHIMGAAYLDLASPDSDFINADSDLPYLWPRDEEIKKGVMNAGIGPGDFVVLYAAPQQDLGPNAVFWATRAWWMMHQAGINCAILDGGWTKWTTEARPISSDPRVYPTTQVEPRSFQNEFTLNANDLSEILEDEDLFLVHALSRESYRGDINLPYTKRPGHIPGASNLPYTEIIDAQTGCFLDPDTIRQKFLDLGYQGNGRPVFYCGGGVAVTMLAFAYYLGGFGEPQIYAAGLMEWANRPDLPMETH